MTLLIQYTLIFASVLMLVALGGCFAERSGVINIGLEGIMVIGALGGALVLKFMPVTVGAPVMVITTVIVSALFGMIFSLLLAVAAINFKADQTITGTAMNMLATAAATVAVKAMNTAASGGNDVSSDISYTRTKDLLLVHVGGFELNWFMLVAVLCLIGRCDLAWGSDNPFTTADRLLKAGEKPTFTLVDFHAQATSEKLAMAYYLDGRVSALWGTHTHVPTADERVFPKGTGYITDLGMTGAVESVLGIRPEQSVESFLGGLPGRYRPAEGPCKAQGALFTLESSTGLCTAVERVDIR